MRPITTVVLTPVLPARLHRLYDVAMNLRWAWDHDAWALFQRLDPDLWRATRHDPVRLLGAIDQQALDAAVGDDGFLAHLDRVASALDMYVSDASTWFARAHGRGREPLAAYFSAEFGLAECLPLYAGGLGVLAGDHLKSASDLGVPIVGVGLLYREGYFRQRLNGARRQEEVYEESDWHTRPVALVRRADGDPLMIRLRFPGRTLCVRVWRAQVGRVPLFLLDTDVEPNTPADRAITHRLYGGDDETRIQQEIILGIGGMRALAAMRIDPMVCHMNEGHSAFLAIERARSLMEQHGIDFAAARELAGAGLVFTTHTPVAAGHDRFAPDLMARYFGDVAASLGLSWPAFLGLGRERPDDRSEPFTMTVLALRFAAWRNGVSRAHGAVSRWMWGGLWPAVPEHEVPIGHVTNGVHLPSWVSAGMADLFERYVGPQWREAPPETAVWSRIRGVPAEELWRTHERDRERLVAFVRARLRESLARTGAAGAEIVDAGEALTPSALTIVFARRFATYKRAWLLFHDLARLERIVSAPGRPVQIVIAGKAHPRDDAGKELIHRVATLAREPRFRRHIAFVEDYDVDVARALVQGADVWLTTPIPPNEASGTSGMKAGASGAVNLSTMDGWWAEAWNGGPSASPPEPIGWTIAEDASAASEEQRDAVAAETLYELLEREIVPTFYQRGADGLPHAWVERMRISISHVAAHFGAHRMVREYAERFYVPAHAAAAALQIGGAERARRLAEWRSQAEQCWPQISIDAVEVDAPPSVPTATPIPVRVVARLGGLSASHVRVQVSVGAVDARGELRDAAATDLALDGEPGDGRCVFRGAVTPPRMSGEAGLAVRIIPRHPDLASSLLPGLITWAPAHVATRVDGARGEPLPEAGESSVVAPHDAADRVGAARSEPVA